MKDLMYKNFGVDIDRGHEFVNELKPLVKKTFSPLVVGELGGFSGCFELPSGYKNPILCAATDGVGSKLKLAISHNKLNTIGIDLVAMCVNDLICDFAKPLFFLDYYAMHKLIKEEALELIQGIVNGCLESGCSLIGGESAEMPSLYAKGEFDIAGFALGIAEKNDIQKRQNIKEGDIILSLPSSGFHSNGYSLIRGIIDKKKIDIYQKLEGDKNIIDSLLEPTRIYVKEFLVFKDKIKALAHITGGGIKENLIRVLPEGVRAIIDSKQLKIPEIFNIFLSYIDTQEAFRTFNMGSGLILIAHSNSAKDIINKSDAYIIGYIENGKKEVIIQ